VAPGSNGDRRLENAAYANWLCVDYTQHPFGVNAPDDAPWIESQNDFVEIAELGAFAHNVGTQGSVIDLSALIFGGEGSAGSETAASDSNRVSVGIWHRGRRERLQRDAEPVGF